MRCMAGKCLIYYVSIQMENNTYTHTNQSFSLERFILLLNCYRMSSKKGETWLTFDNINVDIVRILMRYGKSILGKRNTINYANLVLFLRIYFSVFYEWKSIEFLKRNSWHLSNETLILLKNIQNRLSKMLCMINETKKRWC